jgi:hypothetical protein
MSAPAGYPDPPAGWYPDPSGRPGQRYWDGHKWTEHFAPPTPYPYPYPYPPQPVAVAVSNGGGVNHALHAVLTFFTCGMWLPVWILCAIFGRSGSSVAVAGHGVSVNTGNRKPVIAVAVVVGWFLLGASVMHPWLLAVFAVIGGIGGLIWWIRKDDAKRARLAAHADYEDKLYYQGDPRGTYGRYMPPPMPPPPFDQGQDEL